MFGRKVARRYGIRDYPSLTFFRGGDPDAFEGNALRSDDVVAFLTNPDALQLPDKIEVVRADALFKIIRKEEQVAVLFYDDKVRVSLDSITLRFLSDRSTLSFPQNLKSLEALQQLEHIDDEAVLFGISFVRTSDREASSAFGIVDSLPSLVYFRHKIPVVFGGQLDDEEEVFEFLYQSRFVKPGYGLAGICTILPSRLCI